MNIKSTVFLVTIILAGLPPAWAQTYDRLAFKQAYPLTLKKSVVGDDSSSAAHTIQVASAPWLRLHITDHKLGSQDFFTITSLLDGGMQRLDAKSLRAWRSNTAFFNGDAVRVELFTAGNSSGAFVRIHEITVGVNAPHLTESPDTICGANDDRTAINDAPVGRINTLNNGTNVSNPFCTGWAVSNGTFLTAGHCADFDADGTVDARFANGVLEFNVPASQANGTTVFAVPNDQYPINQVTWQYTGPSAPTGLDWAVFSVSANSNTGLLPQPSRGYYRMTDQTPTANSENVRVTGYGIDNTPAGTTGGENAQTYTLQSHTNTYLGQTQASGGTFHTYSVDTTPANSGSPIVWSNNPNFTIGIHTDGGCTATGGFNAGTSFGHDALENALQNFWGANTVFVDSAAYPNLAAGQRDGSIFRPHSTLGNGLNATQTGGNLVLTPNNYTGVTTFNRAMTIRAPAGTATISP